MRTFALLFLVAAIPLKPSSAQSPEPFAQETGWTSDCDFCLAAQGISPLEVGAPGVRIDVRYLRVGTPYHDGSRVANDERELETHLTQQYSVFFAPTERFAFATLVPFSRRHSEELSEDGELITGDQFGIGDVSVLARYKALVEHSEESTTIVSVAAGMKLATGRTDGKNSVGELLDAHVQLGTGSTDFLAGVSGFLAWDRTALIANLLGGITTRGANGHQFGNSVNYDLSLRYRVYPSDYEGMQFFATLGVNGEWRGRELQDGIDVEDSGGNVTYVAPGIQVFFSPAISFEAVYQYPFLHGLHGHQLGEDYRIMGGLQFLLR